MATAVVQSKPYIIVSGPEAQGMIDNLLAAFTGPEGSRVLKLDVAVFLQLETFIGSIRAQLELGGIIPPKE
jgi:small basic protein